jgi:hypothetical protein
MPVAYAKPEWLNGLLFLAVVFFLGGTFCLLNLPTQDPGIRRGLLRLAACLAFAAALVSLFTENWYIIEHAPRVTVTGSLTTLSEDRGGRSGPYGDFRVDMPAWQYYTFHITMSHREYKSGVLQIGDRVTMLVRLWDIKVETLDEVSGSHPGWRYEQIDDPTLSLLGMAMALPFVGYGVVKLFEEKTERVRGDEDYDSPDDDDSGKLQEPSASEIQTLGLDKQEER